MSKERSPRSKIYDGPVYGYLVDPLLAGVHGFVAERLPAGDRVLDACCGTGALGRKLAGAGRQVTGVDLSPRNIAYAEQRRHGVGLGPGQLRFQVADVAQLRPPEEGPFDVATIILALHEMPSEARLPVIEALTRCARRVMVVDFRAPMPRNLAGLRNRAMELAAGQEHFKAFRDYTRRGGLAALIEQAGAEVESERVIDGGALQVALLKGSG